MYHIFLVKVHRNEPFLFSFVNSILNLYKETHVVPYKQKKSI